MFSLKAQLNSCIVHKVFLMISCNTHSVLHFGWISIKSAHFKDIKCLSGLHRFALLAAHPE